MVAAAIWIGCDPGDPVENPDATDSTDAKDAAWYGRADASTDDAADVTAPTLPHLGPPEQSSADLFDARSAPCLFDQCEPRCTLQRRIDMPVGEFTDVVDDGRYLYAASDFGLEIFEFDGVLRRVGHHPLPGESTAIDVHGDRVAVVDEAPDATHVFDVSDVTSPAWLGALEPELRPRPDFTGIRQFSRDLTYRNSVEIASDLVVRRSFVPDEGEDTVNYLELFALDDSGSPVSRTRISPGGDHFINDFVVDEDHLHVISGPWENGGPRVHVSTWDVSDAANPRELSAPRRFADIEYVTDAIIAYDFDRDLIAYHHSDISSDSAGLYLIDVSAPAQPRRRGHLSFDEMQVDLVGLDVAVASQYLGVRSRGASGLVVVDISSPDQPRHLGMIADVDKYGDEWRLARGSDEVAGRIFSFPQRFYRDRQLHLEELYSSVDLSNGYEGAVLSQDNPGIGPTQAPAQQLDSLSFTSSAPGSGVALRGRSQTQGTTLLERQATGDYRGGFLMPFAWWETLNHAERTSNIGVVGEHVITLSPRASDLGVRDRTPDEPVVGEPAGTLQIEAPEPRSGLGLYGSLAATEDVLVAAGLESVALIEPHVLDHADIVHGENGPVDTNPIDPLTFAPLPEVDRVDTYQVPIAIDGRWAFVLHNGRQIYRLDLSDTSNVDPELLVADTFLLDEPRSTGRIGFAAGDGQVAFIRGTQTIITYEHDPQQGSLRPLARRTDEAFNTFHNRMMGLAIDSGLVFVTTAHRLHVLDARTLHEMHRVRLPDWSGHVQDGASLFGSAEIQGNPVAARDGVVHIASRSHYGVYEATGCLEALDER